MKKVSPLEKMRRLTDMVRYRTQGLLFGRTAQRCDPPQGGVQSLNAQSIYFVQSRDVNNYISKCENEEKQ